MSAFDWSWILLLAPVAGFLLQAAIGGVIIRKLGKQTGKKILGIAAVLPVALGFGISCYLFYQLTLLQPNDRAVISTLFDWINLQTLRVPFELKIDTLSITMCLIVTGIGALIHLYATAYMEHDRDYARFFTYLNLFIAFMLILVLGNNLLLVFIGWEGVGLCSYLLIGFWYQSIENAKAANKAFIVNRIGDWGMILGVFLIYVVYASNASLLPEGENRLLSFDVIFPHAQAVLGEYGPFIVNAIPILLFIGAMGKSAQFPLYLWLPDAMAGPTPVSALIHAATMVTAGIYLVTRCHIFFELSPLSMMIVAATGAFTAIFAATIAFGQTDIKKILAYSTVSQLGYMFLACGVGAFYVGMFHVTTHAFFKALLFLGSGAVIVAMVHNQDIRNYGNLWKYMPFTYFTMLIGWLAICGIFPLAGFFSKDDILSKSLTSQNYWSGEGWALNTTFIYAIGLITAIMTAAYMTRLFILTFHSRQERWRLLPETHHSHDAPQTISTNFKKIEHSDHAMYLTEEEVQQRQLDDTEGEEHHELSPAHTPKEVKLSMLIPLVVLAILSLVGGATLSGMHPFDALFHFELPHYFELWTDPAIDPVLLPEETMYHASHTMEWVLVLSSLAAAAAGIVYMIRRYRQGLPKDEEEMQGIRAIAGNQWYFDWAMTRVFVDWGGKFSNGLYRWIDQGIIDGVFVNGSAKLVGAFGLLLRKTQSGYVRRYALVMLMATVVILTYIGWVSWR